MRWCSSATTTASCSPTATIRPRSSSASPGASGTCDNDGRRDAARARSTRSRLQHVIAAHLSQQNNTPEQGARGARRRARLRARLDRHRRPGATASTGACARLEQHGPGRHGKATGALPRQGEDGLRDRRSALCSSCTFATTCRRSTASSSRSSRRRARPTTASTRSSWASSPRPASPTHFVRLLNERESLVKAMKMVPVECVVRNVCAGSMAKRYGIAEGTRLPEPIFEFFLQERRAARSAVQRRSHPRARLGERRRDRAR